MWRRTRIKKAPAKVAEDTSATKPEKKKRRRKKKKSNGDEPAGGGPPLLSRLHAYCSTTVEQISASKRMCKVIAIDGTALTNNKGLTLVVITTFGADEVSFPMLGCLAKSENDVAMQFLCGKALPFIFGKILDSITLALSDDGNALVKALATAIANKTIGLGFAVQLLCFWHAIYKRRDEATAGFGKLVFRVGTGVATMLSFAGKRAKTMQDVQDAIVGAKAYVQANLTAGTIGSESAAKITSDVIDYAEKNMGKLFPAAIESKLCCYYNMQLTFFTIYGLTTPFTIYGLTKVRDYQGHTAFTCA